MARLKKKSHLLDSGVQLTTIKQYKKYWSEQAFKDKTINEKIRQEAIKVVERLKDILVKEFFVRKIILFGSILAEGCFEADSDIDIAVEGLSKKAYFAALARLMMESQFNVDLKPIEDVSELLRQRIDRGKVLYEKRENS